MPTFELHAKEKMFPSKETESKIQKRIKDMRITSGFAQAYCVLASLKINVYLSYRSAAGSFQ